MKKILPKGLAYDDVLLVPQKSEIKSRGLVNTATKISRHIDLAIPFVSSNVDTVTESSMAILMAKLGGIGFLHRFMPVDKQATEVRKVKRSEGFILGQPLALFPDVTLGEAKERMKQQEVSGFVVVDHQNKVMGIVSERDTWFVDDKNVKVKNLMTPLAKLITALPGVTFKTAKNLFKKYKIEKLPIVKKDGTLAGLITSRTVLNEENIPDATKDIQGRLRVGAAVGVTGDFMERAEELVKNSVDILVIDIAHVHSVHGLSAIKKIRSKFPNVDIVGGNIATAAATKDLIRAGCDAIKVGIGPGGICITRMVAGAGVPQLTAIMECSKIAREHHIPVIADGGTNYPCDMTKALAAGASTVMLTGWIAGTDESPGAFILRNGQKFKVHRGAASFSAVASRKIAGATGQLHNKSLNNTDLNKELETIVAEGVETFVPYRGSAKDVIYQLLGALKSGMSYSNAVNIKKLWQNAQFMEISEAAFKESKAHNVEVV